MGSVIAEFLIGLGIKTDTKPIDDALKKTEDAGRKMNVTWASVGKAAAAAFVAVGAAAVGAATGLFKLADEATKSGDAVAKGARAAGVAADEFQRLNFVAGRSGVETQVLTKAVQNVGKFMEETRQKGVTPFADALSIVGLRMEDLEGLSTEEKFGAIADALNDVEDSSERTALAQKLLGEEAGPRLASLVELGSDGIRELTDEAERLGLVMGKDALDESEKFQDSLSDLRGVIGATARDIGIELAPEIRSVTQDIKEWVIENGDLLRQDIGQLGHELAGGLRAALPAIQATITAVTTMAQTLQGVKLLIDDISGANDVNEENRKALAEFQSRLPGKTFAQLQAELTNQSDRRVIRLVQNEIDRRVALGVTGAEETAELSQAAFGSFKANQRRQRKGKLKNRGKGGGKTETGTDISEGMFLADELFGEQLRFLAEREGVGDIAIDAALEAAASSLAQGSSEEVARRAALSRLGGLAGADLTPKRTKDPLLSTIFGEDMPDVQLSTMALGAEPQTLIATINNNFDMDFDIDIPGAGDPAQVGDAVMRSARELFKDAAEQATKFVKIGFVR